jgi:hypothetical protein
VKGTHLINREFYTQYIKGISVHSAYLLAGKYICSSCYHSFSEANARKGTKRNRNSSSNSHDSSSDEFQTGSVDLAPFNDLMSKLDDLSLLPGESLT